MSEIYDGLDCVEWSLCNNVHPGLLGHRDKIEAYILIFLGQALNLGCPCLALLGRLPSPGLPWLQFDSLDLLESGSDLAKSYFWPNIFSNDHQEKYVHVLNWSYISRLCQKDPAWNSIHDWSLSCPNPTSSSDFMIQFLPKRTSFPPGLQRQPAHGVPRLVL